MRQFEFIKIGNFVQIREKNRNYFIYCTNITVIKNNDSSFLIKSLQDNVVYELIQYDEILYPAYTGSIDTYISLLLSTVFNEIGTGGGTGDVTGASNTGTGYGVFKDKSGTSLRFKSLKQGSNILITESADELEISSTSGGGSGAAIDTTYDNTVSGLISTNVQDAIDELDNITSSRLDNLENNEYKILYYEEISTVSGTITKPVNSTILLNEFYNGLDATVETLVSGKPSGMYPVTSTGEPITVTSFDINGNYVLSGTPTTFNVALLYNIKINALYHQNVNNDYELNREESGLATREYAEDIHTSGLISGGIISINTDPAKIDITSGNGIIVDYWTNQGNPILYKVSWSSQTAITITNLATSTLTYIGIDKNGIIQQYASEPTNTQRRSIILLAQIGHSNNTSIGSINSFVSSLGSPLEQLRDVISELHLINTGNKISANGANLKLNKSNGYLFGLGLNFRNDPMNPHRINIAASTAFSFRYRTQIGGNTGLVSDIDPTKYDNGGVITTVGGGSNESTNQRVYLLPNGNIVIQYGQTTYINLTTAISSVQNESFIEYTNVQQAAILIAVISINRTCTSLQDTTKCRILYTTRLGENIGSAAGISISTLQNVYNNSVTPEILTDSTRGALTLKRGSASDTDNIIEILNGSDVNTASIKGDGTITGSNFIGIKEQFGITLDGQGGVISTGSKGFRYFSNNRTILSWYIKGDDATVGSIVVDIKRSGVSIIGVGNKPTLSSANSATANVSGWTSTTIADGDELEFNVDSVSTFTRINLIINTITS